MHCHNLKKEFEKMQLNVSLCSDIQNGIQIMNYNIVTLLIENKRSF